MDQIKNVKTSECPQKEASSLFFSCILLQDRKVQYKAFRELYCIDQFILRLLLSELEKLQYLTLKVSQNIYFVLFKIWKYL